LADGESFPIAQNSLADRLRQTQQGASYIIKLLIGLAAITPTEKARINRRAARYRWLPSHAANNGGTSLISGPLKPDTLSAPLFNGAQKDMSQLPEVAEAIETDRNKMRPTTKE